MNKKYLGIFVGILLVGVVTALVVDYYSNTVVVNIDVTQPLHLQSSVGSGWSDLPVTVPSSTGGSYFDFYIKAINSANSEIDGNIEVIMTNVGISAECDDFSGVNVAVCDDIECATVGAPVDYVSLGGTCTDALGIATFKIPTVYLASETESYKVTPTWNAGVVPDSYTLSITATN
jgi:hypothetical protein